MGFGLYNADHSAKVGTSTPTQRPAQNTKFGEVASGNNDRTPSAIAHGANVCLKTASGSLSRNADLIRIKHFPGFRLDNINVSIGLSSL